MPTRRCQGWIALSLEREGDIALGVRGKGMHPHLFRHTYATRLHGLGVDLLVIQGLLGHESVATTEIYTRVGAARRRQAIQALEGGSRASWLCAPGGPITFAG